MTTAKAVERALGELHDAVERDWQHPSHPGVKGHLVAALVQLEAVARLLHDTT